MFREKKPRKLILESVRENQIPLNFYERLKAGEDFVTNAGQVIKMNGSRRRPPKGESVRVFADTRYNRSMIEHIRDADLIYHETTYISTTCVKGADARFHSTTKQAAMIAQKTNVRKLLIGHFSSKYDTLEEFESEAREVFPHSEIAREGSPTRLSFSPRNIQSKKRAVRNASLLRCTLPPALSAPGYSRSPLSQYRCSFLQIGYHALLSASPA